MGWGPCKRRGRLPKPTASARCLHMKAAKENLGSESQKLVSGGGCACEEHGSMGKWACDSLPPPTTALQDPRGVRRGRISPWRGNDPRYSFGVQWEPHSSFRTGGRVPHRSLFHTLASVVSTSARPLLVPVAGHGFGQRGPWQGLSLVCLLDAPGRLWQLGEGMRKAPGIFPRPGSPVQGQAGGAGPRTPRVGLSHPAPGVPPRPAPPTAAARHRGPKFRLGHLFSAWIELFSSRSYFLPLLLTRSVHNPPCTRGGRAVIPGSPPTTGAPRR